jgi:hypothetical protein
MKSWRLLAPSFVLLVFVAAGCNKAGGESGKKVIVKGRVTNNGQALPVKAMVGRLQVTFYRMQDGVDQKLVDPKEAIVDTETGNFQLKGGDGKGIEAGTYRICVCHYDSFPPNPSKPDASDLLKGKFAPGKSPIIRDVNDSSGEIIIDVSKPQG